MSERSAGLKIYDVVTTAGGFSDPAVHKPAVPPRFPELTWLFMAIAGGLVLAVILSFEGIAWTVNDGSRWNTVYYLVEHGTYRYKLNHGAGWPGVRYYDVDPKNVSDSERGQLIVITDDGMKRYYRPTGSPPRIGDLLYFPLFPTIDMVRLPDEQGEYHYYSSKPPLLPTILAGVVWVIEKVTHVSFRTNPWFIIRATLIIAQVLPLVLFIWVMGRYARGTTNSWFVHALCVGTAAMGTYLTPWSVTLNNHVLAACTAMFSLYAMTCIWYDGRREWYFFAIAGFFGAFTAVNELPAALLAAAILLALLIKSPGRTISYALVPAFIPVAAFFITNYLATGELKPVYAEFGKPKGGYDYPGSYWNNPSGVDALHEPARVYLMNILVGHHGFFLLMPVFLVSLLGIGAQLSSRSSARPLLAAFVLASTAIIVCFYTFYTTESKNYGGTAQGPRWMFWLIPLWLTMLPPGVEVLGRWRGGRGICYCLLAVSVLSAGFALRQPWGASWAHLLFRQFGWINY